VNNWRRILAVAGRQPLPNRPPTLAAAWTYLVQSRSFPIDVRTVVVRKIPTIVREISKIRSSATGMWGKFSTTGSGSPDQKPSPNLLLSPNYV
jgi:hypothetical protein